MKRLVQVTAVVAAIAACGVKTSRGESAGAIDARRSDDAVPRIALSFDADEATVREFRDGLTGRGVKVVGVPAGIDGGASYLWNADYVVLGRVPAIADPAAGYDLKVRMIRADDHALVQDGRLPSAGATYLGRLVADAVTAHWRGAMRSGVIFTVVGEGLSFPQVRKLERALETSGAVLRSRTERFSSGEALYDVSVLPQLSPHDLAQRLDGLDVGGARAKVVGVTETAVHLSLAEEPASP